MATGDQADFVSRLLTALPLRWFPSDAPILNGVLSGLAATWAVIWQNLQFVIAQARILSERENPEIRFRNDHICQRNTAPEFSD